MFWCGSFLRNGRGGISSKHALPSTGRLGSDAPKFALPTGVEERCLESEPFPLEGLASVDGILAGRERLQSSFDETDVGRAGLGTGWWTPSRFKAFIPRH